MRTTFKTMALCAALAAAAVACKKEDDNGGTKVGGVTWAACNVDDYQTFAAKPDAYTKHYQWNRSKAWSATDKNVSGWNSSSDQSSTWTVNPCPDGWRLPTADEFEALHNAGTTWAAANTKGNAVAGRFYGANHATATMSNLAGCVFLPAGGDRSSSSGTLNYQGSSGYYWSATECTSSTGFSMTFYDTKSDPNGFLSKPYGFTLRCVK